MTRGCAELGQTVIISTVLLEVLCHGLLSILEAADEEKGGERDTACVMGAGWMWPWCLTGTRSTSRSHLSQPAVPGSTHPAPPCVSEEIAECDRKKVQGKLRSDKDMRVTEESQGYLHSKHSRPERQEEPV